MLFEAAGIIEILAHASQTSQSQNGKQLYHITVSAGSKRPAVKGFSGV